MCNPSVSVIGLYIRISGKISNTDKLLIFHSLMVGMWRQWLWDLEVEFLSVEWQSHQYLNGSIMVISAVIIFTTFPDQVHLWHPDIFNYVYFRYYLHRALHDGAFTESACLPRKFHTDDRLLLVPEGPCAIIPWSPINTNFIVCRTQR